MAIIVTFALCVSIGAVNGYIVVRTGLPSFIVTLAFLFILRGFTIYLPQTIERKTIIGGIRDVAEGDWLASVFGGKVGQGFFVWLGDNGLIDKNLQKQIIDIDAGPGRFLDHRHLGGQWIGAPHAIDLAFVGGSHHPE
jgi:hypothetical protein